MEVIVDKDDYKKLSEYHWTIYYKNGYPYVITTETVNKKQRLIYLHRLITNAPKGKVVDHINGNSLDNRKTNLRVCSNKENCRNRKANKKSKTGYKGVIVAPTKKKNYYARIKVDGKQQSLGVFKTEEEAATAYNIAALLNFGEFANLNVIKKGDK